MTTYSLHAITYLAPRLEPVYRFVTSHISKRLFVPVSFAVGHDYAEVHTADLAFICGLPYVRRADYLEAIAAPVLMGERYQDQPIYFSDVIVRTDTPYHSFTDLRGCRWAYNEPESQSGYGITRYRLLEMSMTSGFFGEVRRAGFHSTALQQVVSGEVDAAAIDSHVLALALHDDPALARQIRVIDTLGPSSIQPLAVRRSLPDRLKADLRAVLACLHTKPEAQALFTQHQIKRYVTTDDERYNDIRHMVEACQQANFLDLR